MTKWRWFLLGFFGRLLLAIFYPRKTTAQLIHDAATYEAARLKATIHAWDVS